MSYTADPTNPSLPASGALAGDMYLELQGIKLYLQNGFKNGTPSDSYYQLPGIEYLKTQIQSVNNEITTINNEITTINNEISSLQNSFNTLQNAVNSNYNTLVADINNINTSISYLESLISSGLYRNLRITSGNINYLSISVTADYLITVGTINTNLNKILGLNVTANISTSIDTGSIAANTWYAIYVLYNQFTEAISLIFSTNFIIPVFPGSGYNYARVGCCRTDGSANIIPFIKLNNKFTYIAPSGYTLPLIVSGSVGSTSSPGWDTVNIENFVPTSFAENIEGYLTPNGSTGGNAILAPDSSYRGYNSSSKPPYVQLDSASGVTGNAVQFDFDLIPGNTVIYYASSRNAAVYCTGFKDSI